MYMKRKLSYPFSVGSGLVKTSASVAVLCAMGAVAPAVAQTDNDADDQLAVIEEIHIRGQRASLETARDIKRDADGIVDSIVADDIGKLPDRSIAEALQRVSGVSVSRFDSPGDPEHFAGEGAGVAIRGLPQVRGELNGRDIFSASGGRGLSWQDVPAELMAGVDVHKTPTADMIEGGLGGIVNLRTRKPFDSDGQLVSFTARGNYGDIVREFNAEGSGLYSNVWDTELGRLGFLVNLSYSNTKSQADNVYNRAFFPRSAEYNNEIEPGQTVWSPNAADWRRNGFQSERNGQYLALQWAAPNDDIEVFFTAFRSEADRDWNEQAFFIDGGAGGPGEFLITKGADDWVYDDNNALISGTITTAQGNGFGFGTSTRAAFNNAVTIDYSAGFRWDVTDQLTITGDLQHVDSTSKGENYTIGLVTYPQTVVVGNLDGTPSISVPGDHLTDPANFSHGQQMVNLTDNAAEATAARLDVRYDFEDSVVRSVRAGARYAEKSARNRDTGYVWVARYQPWLLPWAYPTTDDLPKITEHEDLPYSDYVEEFSFDRFQRGNAQVPTSGIMYRMSILDDFEATTTAITAGTPGTTASALNWDEGGPLDLNNPDNVNTQDETTIAVYARMDFSFADMGVPVSGNIGVRYADTENTATGRLRFPTFSLTRPAEDPDSEEEVTIQPFYQDDIRLTARNSYSNFMPSLNLRWDPTQQLVFRVSASRGIWRPEFSNLSANLNLSADFPDDVSPPDTIAEFDPSVMQISQTTDFNPYLKPMEADQFDLTTEWYYDQSGSFAYLGLFKKNVRDFFRIQTTKIELGGFDDVTSIQRVNTGKADVRGFELGTTWFFDFDGLPPALEGFGVHANYTYIDTSTNVDDDASVSPIDTNGSTAFGAMPLEGLAEHTVNLALLYENHGFWGRLAYFWVDEHLLSIGPNGWQGSFQGNDWRLPIYQDAYGQLDLTFGYNFTDNVSVGFEIYNLTQEDLRGSFEQTTVGRRTAFVYSQDRRYGASLRVTF